MGKLYPELDGRLRKFIARQSVFFVATAPILTSNGDGGHVNVSPKGLTDTFAVLGPRTVAYLDLTGSGAETIAHLRQNGQITIMFCSFDHARRYCGCTALARSCCRASSRWDELAAHFPRVAGGPAASRAPGSERSIIVVDVHRIADSCGYAVPVMEVKDERDVLDRYNAKKSAAEQAAYRAEKNAVSIDGLPALS